MKIKESTINIILLCLSFYEPEIVPHALFLIFKYAVILWIFVRYLKEAERFWPVFGLAALYGGVTLFSSCLNHMRIGTIIAAGMYALQLLCVFLMTEAYLKKYSLRRYTKNLLCIFLLLCLSTDLLILVKPYRFWDPEEQYLIGNKFIVSYVHCFTTALAYMYFVPADEKKMPTGLAGGKIRLRAVAGPAAALLCAIISVLICMRVTCSTGAIMVLAFTAAMFIPFALKQMISCGKSILASAAVLNVLLLGSCSILRSAYVQNFIKNVLGKSLTLTGRLQIWEIIFDLIAKKPIIGYGYYNRVITDILGYGNPQNGALKFLLDSGLVGLVSYALLVMKCFGKIKDGTWRLCYPMVAFFYAMLLASLVEINLTHMIVFLSMAIAFSSIHKTGQRGRQ